MKLKIIILIVVGLLAGAGGYTYYKYNYLDTLMLSEIIGKSDNPVENMLTGIFDFDTGLTRHDISQIEKRKDYWMGRFQEVQNISDPDRQAEELSKLYNEMDADPSMKKLTGIVFDKSINIGRTVLEAIN